MNNTAAQASEQQQSSIRTHSELGASEHQHGKHLHEEEQPRPKSEEEEEEQARVKERRGSEEACTWSRAPACHGGTAAQATTAAPSRAWPGVAEQGRSSTATAPGSTAGDGAPQITTAVPQRRWGRTEAAVKHGSARNEWCAVVRPFDCDQSHRQRWPEAAGKYRRRRRRPRHRQSSLGLGFGHEREREGESECVGPDQVGRPTLNRWATLTGGPKGQNSLFINPLKTRNFEIK
jgi:hypothetical protein